ncbi:MAG: two-component system sensor histidine kinase NtrB [Terriglobia bacterium]
MPDVSEVHQGASRRWLFSGLLLAVASIGVLQYLTPPTLVHWLYILQRAYYVPIVLAGLSRGWRQGLTVALLAGGAFAVGTPSIWNVPRVDVLDQCLEICVFCLVGLTAGVLTDRKREQERALFDTTNQLRQAHRELRDNFESLKRAERLYALGQLSAGLAHEIRNPLASIEGAAGVLRRENPSERRRLEFLDIIQKESRRLNQLLTRFLRFAKPAAPDIRVVGIGDLLDSVVSLARHADGAGRVELRKEIKPGASTVECDPEQMKQVLLNLVMNAAQAMPQGGTVVLRAQRDDSRFSIDVEDQGVGISQENVERVFDPFFTTKDAGTGLGLSVAHQIINQHGGRLTVLRNSPEGVTVRISIPLKASCRHDREPDSHC